MSVNAARSDYRALFLQATPMLDVRAPVEFSKGAFPTAVNIPLLDDHARHEVGIEYKLAGQQSAIELGAKLVDEPKRAALIAQWTQFAEQNPSGVLYCFRGGLRSRTVQQWLLDAGIDYPLVSGGYKAMRSFLADVLQEQCRANPLCLISGRTGIGKTRLLPSLPRVIDLEGLARHRGSSFGRLVEAQPSNIDFENAIAIELLRLTESNSNVIYLEDEARMIGSACIPAPMREQMQLAPVAILKASLQERVANATQDYVVDLLQAYESSCGTVDGFEQYADYHRSSLQRVQKRLGGVRYKQALQLLEAALASHQSYRNTDDYAPFIELLLTQYYDPMYDYQMQAKKERVVFSGNARELIQWANQMAHTA
jgi:tRNA 2-selenouridine synthase